MARDISSIRQQALVREGKEIPQAKLQPHEVPSVSSLRSKELKEEGVPIILDKAKTAQKLSEIIKKKRKELATTAEATKSLVDDASTEAERIISEAKTKALALTTQANTDKNAAKVLFDQAKRQKKEAEDLGVEISQREGSLEKGEKKLEEGKKQLTTGQTTVENLLTTASKTKEQVVDIFVNAVSLLQLIFEQLEQAQNLDSEARIDVSQTLQKAGTMIKRIDLLLKVQGAKEERLNQKDLELKKEKVLIDDRRQQIERVEKEVKQKHG